ncbi:MAG: hypothetical protein GC153_11350 [Alphaproteobacteria bacterium]|nr:hypothetical protein [Alphaproteobacteria bacterium]
MADFRSGGARRRQCLRQALLTGAACVLASGAAAQVTNNPSAPLKMKTNYFGYSASVSPRVAYSDNINLAPKGLEQSSAFLSNLISGAAIYSGKRFTGVINGDLDLSYITRTNDFGVNQNIGAASTFTVADNLAYIDLDGSTSRQLLGENARFSTNVNAARSQRANVHTYSVSPYLFHQFADESSAQLRYRLSQVFVGDKNANANPFGRNYLNDTTTQEASAVYDTGHAFERLHVTATAYANRTIEQGSVVFPRSQYDQGTAMAEIQYALTSQFALAGAVGYDDINTKVTPSFFNDNMLSGLFWRAGFVAQPGRRTYLRAEYGRRYDKDFIDATLSYQFTNRVRFTAGANQTFQTRAQTISADYLTQERSLLQFVDQLRQGAELSADQIVARANRFSYSSLNYHTSGLGLSKNAHASLQAAFSRTDLELSSFYQDTDFGYREDKSIAATLNARRDLSRRLSAYAGVFYRHTETAFDSATCLASPYLFGFDVNAPLFNPVTACLSFAAQNGKTNTAGGKIGAAYRIYKNLSAFAEYAHTKRWAQNALLEYVENNGVAGVTVDF